MEIASVIRVTGLYKQYETAAGAVPVLKDGNLIITGIEYSPIKNIQTAIDYQGFLFADKEKDSKNLIYFNFQYAF